MGARDAVANPCHAFTSPNSGIIMKIEIWSDIACPWCYVGKRRFERALMQFEHRDEVEVRWRSFELDPSAPASQDETQAALLARKYRLPLAEAEAMNTRMAGEGAKEGIDFHFERVRAANSFDAHRLLHLAHEHGRQDALEERLFSAYFTDGALISEHEVLTGLAVEVGLDAEEAQAALAERRYAAGVRADESTARELGINGVPFFVIDRKYGVSGAQPAEALLAAMREGYAARDAVGAGEAEGAG
jgi:predicted DsbA family dithiol-disulfide isomerase